MCSILRGPTLDDNNERPIKRMPADFSPCQTRNSTLPLADALFFRLLETPSCGFNNLDDNLSGAISIIGTGKSAVIIN